MSDEKYTHREVDYEHPAQGMHICGECRHYIDSTPPDCKLVQQPIRHGDWCRKFEPKEKK